MGKEKKPNLNLMALLLKKNNTPSGKLPEYENYKPVFAPGLIYNILFFDDLNLQDIK